MKSNFENKDFYFIAEIGVNHEGRIEDAKKIIDAAKRAGADAVKFQTYKAEKLASRIAMAYWDMTEESTNNQFELFKKYDALNFEDYRVLAEYCRELDIDFASTPFDLDAVDFLNSYVTYFKIASADITNLPLIRRIAQKNKPIILSTGASNKEEISQAIHEIKIINEIPITLLHCVLNYPTQNYNANLRMISDLQESFPNCRIGYSDHTKPNENYDVLILSYALGARVIEKHFTIDKNIRGNDHYHSMDENDVRNFLERLKSVESILGSAEKNFLASEEPARVNARRSIFYSSDLGSGDFVNSESFICLRPGIGISPMKIDEIVGRKLRRSVNAGDLVELDDFQ